MNLGRITIDLKKKIAHVYCYPYPKLHGSTTSPLEPTLPSLLDYPGVHLRISY
jgi:hypothetical protein